MVYQLLWDEGKNVVEQKTWHINNSYFFYCHELLSLELLLYTLYLGPQITSVSGLGINTGGFISSVSSRKSHSPITYCTGILKCTFDTGDRIIISIYQYQQIVISVTSRRINAELLNAACSYITCELSFFFRPETVFYRYRSCHRNSRPCKKRHFQT